MRHLLTIAFLALTLTSNATTYYISTSGSDSANGTSKVTPWAHCPGMRTFTGSYSHTAGDRFIFKGGESWGVSNFQMKPAAGGSSDVTRDYYGTDNTWFTGGSFSRAVFSGQDSLIGSGLNGAGILLSGIQWINFGDGLDIKNFRADSSFGIMTISEYNADNIKLTNCIVRDWSIPLPASAGSDGGGGIGYFGGGGGSNLEVDHCTMHQATRSDGCISGSAVYGLGTVKFSEFHHTASALHAAYNIHDNSIHDLMVTSDTTKHTDSIITFSGCTIYNNYIHDLVTQAAPIELTPSASFNAGTDSLIYNNVIYAAGGQTPCFIICDSSVYSGQSFRVFNNTFEHGNGYCVMVEDHGSGVSLGSLDVRNNHFITTGLAVAYRNVSSDTGLGSVTSATVSNNRIESGASANSFGYTSGNQYAPTSSSSPTVGAGLTLSSIFTTDLNNNVRTVPWDIGAYEYAAVGGSPGIVQLSVSAVTASEGGGALTFTAKRASGSTGAASVHYATADGSAVAGVNYSSASGTLSWSDSDATDKTFTVSPINASMVGSKTFTVAFSGAVGASLGSPSTETVTLTGTGTPPPNVLTGLSWEAEAGTLSSPMQTGSGSGRTWVFSPIDAPGVATGGQATYTFTAPTTGAYKVSAIVSTADQSQNSVYAGFETDSLSDPATVWDMIITGSGVWSKAYVSWRGTGSNVSPEFPLKTWSLSAGQHTLTIIAREQNTLIDSVTVELISAPVVTVYSVVGANKSLKAGMSLPITVSFLNPVSVTGFPKIALNTGGSASYTSGTGTTNIVFTYTVSPGENTQLLEYVSTSALTLNGGTVNDGGGNPVSLTLPVPGALGSLSASYTTIVDTISPAISISGPVGQSPVTYTVTYLDTNFSRSTLTNSDVTLNRTGTANATVNTATDNANHAFILLSGQAGIGTLGVSVGAGTGSDLAGNLAGAAGPSATVQAPGTVQLSSPTNSVPQSSGSIFISVNRLGTFGGAVSVTATTADGTAVAGHDYVATTNTLSWADGTGAARTFAVPMIQSGDTANTNRTFSIALSNPTGGAAIVSPSTEVITILMNSPTPPPPPPTNAVVQGTVFFNPVTYSTNETGGLITLSVTRTGGTNAPISVVYSTLNGSAVAGFDYTATSGQLAWLANENTTKTFPIPIRNSGSYGPPRSFIALLSNPTPGTVVSANLAAISITMSVPVGITTSVTFGNQTIGGSVMIGSKP